MRNFARAAVIAAGFAAVSTVAMPVLAMAARAADLAPSLQSFGAAKALSAYELSAVGVVGFQLQPTIAASLSDVSPAPPRTLSSFAASNVLSQTLALDSGTGLDIASRFANYGATASPFASAVSAPYLGLANGGRYAGVTFVPASNLRLRLGASLTSERLDHFSFDPIAAAGNVALTYEPSQTRSLLAGLSWNVSDAFGLDFTGISADRSGVPLGLADAAHLAPRARTNALGVAGHVDIGQGWITTAAFNEGMTQLNQRGSQAGATLAEQSYSIAIAKHGLFGGDDSLGLSLSRPAPSLIGSFSSLIGSSGDLPPLIISQAQALGPRAPETDFQLGYVTNFLDGAVALQTNAAYQTNFQGQPGATSVSLLSRAKIKF